MSAKGMFAWAKCKVNFAKSEKFLAAMQTYAPGATLDSCSVTQSVLGLMISPGAVPKSVDVKRSDLGVTDSTDVMKKVSDLLNGDNVIYLSISPNHYFTVLPLSRTEVGMLQGFQGSYNLSEWLQARNDGVLVKSEFLMNLFLLFSPTVATAIDAAKFLFAIPGKEGDIASWFKNGNIRLTQFASCAL